MRQPFHYLATLILTSVLLLPLGCKRDSTGPGLDGGTNENGNDGTVTSCTDVDGDGYGVGCSAGPDCDDLDRFVNPGAPEACGDGKDNNCNGAVDEGCPCDLGSQRLCSSYGDPQTMGWEMACRPGIQYCGTGGTWDATCVGEVGPQAETCNGIDDNCDGEIDEGLRNPVGECDTGQPVPPEDCGPTGEGNGIDDNGDGQVDETCSCAVPGYDPELPRQHQVCYSGPIYTLGVGTCHGGYRDCLANGTWGPCVGEVLPAAEVCGDGLDNDCDGIVDDGCPRCVVPETEVCDDRDNDCDGLIDEGVRNACGGCGPVADAEVCDDGLDNDCNGMIDDGCPGCEQDVPCYPGPPETAGVGTCAYGTRSCQGEFWSPCQGYVLPRPEDCGPDGQGNGIDEDCDGIPDDGCICWEGETRPCGRAAGICQYGSQMCTGGRWGECLGGVGPAPEVCDGVDNDCDGLADEGLLNACGTCGQSCYELPMDPTTSGTRDDGIAIVTGAESPDGLPGISLTASSFIPPYLWAANHDYGTVAKLNTDTNTQEGLYWVGSNPSRTAVDLDGNMWVGGRNDGRLTKIIWDRTSCPDQNGNGTIETSSGTNQLNSAANPFADECVVFSTVPQPGYPSIRGIAAGADGRVWVGYSYGGVQSFDTHTFAAGTHHTGGYGGAAQIPVWEPDANGVYQPTANLISYGGTYGLVVDSTGVLYMSSWNRSYLFAFDTNTETWIGAYHRGGSCSYGITVDAEDRVWTGGYDQCSGATMFDPSTRKLWTFGVAAGCGPTPGQQCAVNLVANAGASGNSSFYTTGVGVEPATGDVWVSFYPLGYNGRLRVNWADLAASTWTMIATTRDVNTNQQLAGVGVDLRGVGFDYNGYAWTLGLGSDRVWKIDPATNARSGDLPNGISVITGTHYTYSDFTGSTALNFTAPRGYWRYLFETGFDPAQVDGVYWEAYVPAGTTAGVRVRALDASNNPISGWVPAENMGSPVFIDYPTGQVNASTSLAPYGGPLLGASFEVEVRLTTNDRDVRPVVHTVQLEWQRP